jgi:hypothetical protein
MLNSNSGFKMALDPLEQFNFFPFLQFNHDKNAFMSAAASSSNSNCPVTKSFNYVV